VKKTERPTLRSFDHEREEESEVEHGQRLKRGIQKKRRRGRTRSRVQASLCKKKKGKSRGVQPLEGGKKDLLRGGNPGGEKGVYMKPSKRRILTSLIERTRRLRLHELV